MPCIHSGAPLTELCGEQRQSVHLFLGKKKGVSSNLQAPRRRQACTHQDDTIEPLLEPSHRVVLGNAVLEPNARLALLSPRHAHPRSPHDHIKVHTENPNTRVIPRTEIDVLLDPEPKVARVRKVLPSELVLFHFETALEDLFGFGPADGDVDGDLFVSTDAKGADGVAGFGGHGRLAGELFQDFGGTGQAIARFADADVCGRETGSGSTRSLVGRGRTDDELLDSELFHGVGWGRFLLGLEGDVQCASDGGCFSWKILAMAVVVSALSCRRSRVCGTGFCYWCLS